MSDGISTRVVVTHVVKEWLANLQDLQGRGAIADRIDRMRSGNFGKIDSIKSEPGLWELIVDEGPGYRVYYGEFEGKVVVLILGGPKSTQKADIKKAGAALRWLQAKEAADKAAATKAAATAAKKAAGGKSTSKRK